MFVLNVPLEDTILGGLEITKRTLIWPLAQMDRFDMSAEATRLAEYFLTMRTLMSLRRSLLAQMDRFDMSLEVSLLDECFPTMWTTERLLLSVASDVHLEF